MDTVTFLHDFRVQIVSHILYWSNWLRLKISNWDEINFLLFLFGLAVFQLLLISVVLRTRHLRRQEVSALETELSATALELKRERVWRRAGGDGRPEISAEDLRIMLRELKEIGSHGE